MRVEEGGEDPSEGARRTTTEMGGGEGTDTGGGRSLKRSGEHQDLEAPGLVVGERIEDRAGAPLQRELWNDIPDFRTRDWGLGLNGHGSASCS